MAASSSTAASTAVTKEEPDEPERTKPSAAKGVRNTMLVGNLPALTPVELESLLKERFEEFTTVMECSVLQDEEGSSRGFAFVRLGNGYKAEEAKCALDGKHLRPPNGDERPIRVRWALDTNTLFVGDLAPCTTEAKLREAFSQFGSLVDCRIEREPAEYGGASRCYGFVEFSKRTVAARVQQLLSDNLFLISNSPRPLRVEFAVDPSSSIDDAEGKPVGPSLYEPPPHFAQPATLEFDFALRWRELALAHKAEADRLEELHRQEREILRQEQAALYAHESAKFKKLDAMSQGRTGAA